MDMQFSNWVKWDSRDRKLSNLNHPGIYALSISKENIEDQSFELTKKICYFGMTNSIAGLKGRLGQFNNSLRDKPGGGHGGALRFRHNFKEKENAEDLANMLFVSVWHFKCEDRKIDTTENLLVRGEVAKAEFVAFSKYFEKFLKLPKYNNKKENPKYDHMKMMASLKNDNPT
jgi:hypothetical protein